jgi:hypothetical protein
MANVDNNKICEGAIDLVRAGWRKFYRIVVGKIPMTKIVVIQALLQCFLSSFANQQ